MKKFFNPTMQPISQKELREALVEILMDPRTHRSAWLRNAYG